MPRGEEGCTPGFWKNHPDDWPVPYEPSDTFVSVFGVVLPGQTADLTLGAALELGGGGVNALARHAVAALLNAAHPDVDYALTEAEIIALVQAALGGTEDVEDVKDMLEGFNEAACPL